MSVRLSAWALVVALLLGGCATTDRQAARAGVQIQRDKFSSAITVVGPPDSVNPYGGTFREWFLKSRVDKTHLVITQLYVDIGYVGSSWRGYGTATDDKATPLMIDKTGSQVRTCFGSGVCSRDEVVLVRLDDGKLKSHVQEGYAVKLSTKSGNGLTITVSPVQIQAQLTTLDKLGAKPGA
ncbi:MAG: hypothetical protein WAM52_07300 [Steroidobacteraceae bacterium]